MLKGNTAVRVGEGWGYCITLFVLREAEVVGQQFITMVERAEIPHQCRLCCFLVRHVVVWYTRLSVRVLFLPLLHPFYIVIPVRRLTEKQKK